MRIKHFAANVDYKKLIKKRIPILNWLPRYTCSILLLDVLAGITVGITEIPQAIAYAVIAGLPPEYGLYSGLFDGFIYAIFGSCKDINIGPTSLMSLMLQPHVARLGPDVAPLITFLSGIIIFLLGILHLGFVVQFFSYPIVAGFICAGSLQIASSQVKNLLGVSGKSNTFLESWTTVVNNVGQIQQWDAVLGLTSVVFILVFKKVGAFGSLQHRVDWSSRRNFLGKIIFILSLSRNGLILVLGTVLAYYLREEAPFKITGEVSGKFPSFQMPPFSTTFNSTNYTFPEIMQSFGASVAFFPLVSTLEAISIAKAFTKGKNLDATQEMLALGLCNVVGSFIRSMPVTGSFSRSAINHASSVRTTLAGVFTSLLLVLTIAFVTPAFYFVPKATLAAVIICAMFTLFDFEAFVLIWKTKKLDFVPFFSTFFCSLFLSIEYGILIGTGVNLLFVLYASARPKFDIIKEKIVDSPSSVFIITPKDTLYFPAAEYLRDVVLSCEEASFVVINGRYIRNMDITVAKSIAIIAQEVVARKQMVVFLDFKPSVVDMCLGIDGNLKKYFFSEVNIQNIIRSHFHEDDKELLNETDNSITLSTNF